jgi:hypothetical protein
MQEFKKALQEKMPDKIFLSVSCDISLHRNGGEDVAYQACADNGKMFRL